MDNARLYEMGKKVFEGLFTENPSFLPFIGLSASENWRKSIVFRLHAQRFVTAVCESLRRMRDTQAACDVLRDFGAHYSGHKIPNAYFEKMAMALCGAIKEFEGQTTLIEPEQRHRSPSADPSSSSATDSSAISNGQKIEPKHGSSLSTISNNTTRGEISENKPTKSSGFSSRHSDSSMYRVNGSGALCSNSLRGTPPHNSSDSDSPPIRGPTPSFLPPFPNSLKNLNNINNNNCPITTEAWHIFATFVANQVKLGYELEKVLQYEMAKLGLSTQHTGLQHGGYCSKQFDRPQCFCHYKPRTMAWDVLQHPARIPASGAPVQNFKAPFRWPAASLEKFEKSEIPGKPEIPAIPEQILKPNYFTRPQRIEDKVRGRKDDPEGPEKTTETYLVRLNNDIPMMLPYSARSRKVQNTIPLRDENTLEW
ncbi:unnamed protein product, partial [Mesorhabditis spiculigera]